MPIARRPLITSHLGPYAHSNNFHILTTNGAGWMHQHTKNGSLGMAVKITDIPILGLVDLTANNLL